MESLHLEGKKADLVIRCISLRHGKSHDDQPAMRDAVVIGLPLCRGRKSFRDPFGIAMCQFICFVAGTQALKTMPELGSALCEPNSKGEWQQHFVFAVQTCKKSSSKTKSYLKTSRKLSLRLSGTSDRRSFRWRPRCAQTAEWARSKRCLEVTTLEDGKGTTFAESVFVTSGKESSPRPEEEELPTAFGGFGRFWRISSVRWWSSSFRRTRPGRIQICEFHPSLVRLSLLISRRYLLTWLHDSFGSYLYLHGRSVAFESCLMFRFMLSRPSCSQRQQASYH